MVSRVQLCFEYEQQKGQHKSQRFGASYAGPVHDQHSPTGAVIVASPAARCAPADDFRDAPGT